MKNYLGRLGIYRHASQAELNEAIVHSLDTTSDTESLIEAEKILSAPVSHTHYMRTHLQYEAMKASLSCLEHSEAVDTHLWPERLVEFELADEDNLPVD